MKFQTLTFLLTMTAATAFGQTNDSWTAFTNSDSTLTGFKDKNGVVKIEPKYMGMLFAKKLDGIMAVSEELNGKWSSYYVTKSGRMVGRDSLHIFDNYADCESEGFIRFRDHKSDKAGLYNSEGNIVIPAEYNDLSRVRNGVVVALKGATKHTEAGGEHFSWAGGKYMLIDANNKVLVDDFKSGGNINFYSLKVSDQPDTDPLRHNVKGVNGKYYSFVDFDLEFKAWLKNALPDNFTKEQLAAHTFAKQMLWKEEQGWVPETKENFVNRNYELVKNKLKSLKNKDADYHIFNESLNPMIYEAEEFQAYFNNCGEAREWIYPVNSIVINHKDKSGQDHIDFLRTDDGYKIISITEVP